MTIEQLDYVIELRKQIKAYTAEIERIKTIINNYSEDKQYFEGIRLYSRKYISIELSTEFVTIDEVLHIYVDKLKFKLNALERELGDLLNPPIVEQPIKKRKWL